MKRFGNSKVAAVFRAYPSGVAAKLMALRRLIFDVASRTEGVGALEETTFRYAGNRAILFDETDTVPVEALSRCIALALTYHLAKRRKT